MSIYEIRKNDRGNWSITHVQPGWTTPLGSFPKRKAAILTARLLAGRLGKVVVK